MSFLDYRSIKIAATLQVPCIFFDTLLWSRSSLPDNTENATEYIAQRFFVTPDIHTPRPVHYVGAVLPKETVRKRRTLAHVHTLVNFGGLKSPAMLPDADLNYVRWVVHILQRSAVPAAHLTFCLPRHLASAAHNIQMCLPQSSIEFPDPSAFADLLHRSCTLLTVPGLETVLEALYLNKPMIFLPPYNGTQCLQLDIYEHLHIGATLVPNTIARCHRANLQALTTTIQRANAFEQADKQHLDTLAMRLSGLVVDLHTEGAFANNGACHSLLRDIGINGREETAAIISRYC